MPFHDVDYSGGGAIDVVPLTHLGGCTLPLLPSKFFALAQHQDRLGHGVHVLVGKHESAVVFDEFLRSAGVVKADDWRAN